MSSLDNVKRVPDKPINERDDWSCPWIFYFSWQPGSCLMTVGFVSAAPVGWKWAEHSKPQSMDPAMSGSTGLFTVSLVHSKTGRSSRKCFSSLVDVRSLSAHQNWFSNQKDSYSSASKTIGSSIALERLFHPLNSSELGIWKEQWFFYVAELS